MTADDFLVLMTRDLAGFSREISAFPDDASLWRTVPGVSNPVGNLALHVAGNLRHFVGTILGGTAFRRDREAEFSRRSGTRAEVLAELDDAAATVREVLGRLSADELDAPMTHLSLDAPVSTRRFLLHLCVHLGFHLGQAGYLRRVLAGEGAVSAGGVGLKGLVESTRV